MVDKPLPTDMPSAGTEAHGPTAQPPRSPGGRAPEARDAVAELAERAQIISQEAGSKVAAAMKDVISAAAGIAGFAIESARDLVQFMVRRGQMTQDEADKLLRQAEDAHERRPASERARPTATKVAAERAAAAKTEAAARAASAPPAAPVSHSPHGVQHAHTAPHAERSMRPASATTRTAEAPAAMKPAMKPAKPPATKPATPPATKPAAKSKSGPPTSAMTKAAGSVRSPAKPAARPAAKPAAKSATKAAAKPAAKTARATRPAAKSSSRPGANSAAKKAAPKKKR